MSAIIRILFDICQLRKGPEDLPANNSLVALLVVISITVALILGSYVHDYKISFVLSIVGMAITFIFLKILLVKKPERFMQTFCAMLGVAILIDIISVPVIFPLLNEELNPNLKMLFSFLAIAVYIWYVVVNGFIVSRAISSTIGYGISIVIAYALVGYMIFELILTGRLAE